MQHCRKGMGPLPVRWKRTSGYIAPMVVNTGDIEKLDVDATADRSKAAKNTIFGPL
jgi:hypothetical protein